MSFPVPPSAASPPSLPEKRFRRSKKAVSMVASFLLLVLAILVGLSMTILPIGIGSQIFLMPSSGMDPAITPGDHVYVNFRAYRNELPARGDIVAFWSADVPAIDTKDGYSSYFALRVVGLPGEEISVVDGKLTVNGAIPPELQNLGYVTADFPTGPLRADGVVYRVPQDCIFVLGDNTRASYDSRYWGPLPVSALRGRAEACVWPPNRLAPY
ncbi:MAG: signal peptidase I [Roseimicrobium sp.]